MRGWQPLDLRERRRRGIPIHVEQKKIGYGQIIKLAGNGGVLPDTVQSIAKNDARANVRIKERLDTELVPRAEQSSYSRVPDGEGEVADQMLNAGVAPAFICGKNQFNIGSGQ